VSAPSASVSFDARPLVDPVDRFEVRDFMRPIEQSGAVPSRFASAMTIVPLIVGGVFFAVFGFVFVTIAASILAALASSGAGTDRSWIGAIGVIAPIVVFGGALTAVILWFRRSSRLREERWFRLDRFARANGMSFHLGADAPNLPGVIFTIGSARQASDIVRGTIPRFVEFGNYEYTTGSGKNRTTHRWGYVAIKLDVPLPHIVLDATSNNSLFRSNLPATFDKDQRLSFEGDFDEYFSLYCPQGYEQDALYLFTPDIMARFIDHAAALDVEIVDDWLFLYGKREFSGLDPATWAWLFSIVAALLHKFAQWARWRDDRLRADAAAPASVTSEVSAAGDAAGPAANALPFAASAQPLRPPAGVALTGRRLKRGIPWPAVIVFGIFVVIWLAGQFEYFGFFDWLSSRMR
jgi:hypothetical protein